MRVVEALGDTKGSVYPLAAFANAGDVPQAVSAIPRGDAAAGNTRQTWRTLRMAAETIVVRKPGTPLKTRGVPMVRRGVTRLMGACAERGLQLAD